MPFITITATGLSEMIQKTERMINDSMNAKHEALQNISDFMANQMRANAHVITGRMKGSIRSSVSGDTAIVEVPVPYASIENKRPGSKSGSTHDFADRAVDATEKQGPQMVKTAYDRVL